jgi:hypothetical protein
MFPLAWHLLDNSGTHEANSETMQYPKMSSPTTYQFLVSINVRDLDIDMSCQIFEDEPTQTSALLEAPLDITFQQLTQLAKAVTVLAYCHVHSHCIAKT